MKAQRHGTAIGLVGAPRDPVPAAFYSVHDLRRRCGSPARPASRSKIYRMIAAGIIPPAVPGLNAWSVEGVESALARLADDWRANQGGPTTNIADEPRDIRARESATRAAPK